MATSSTIRDGSAVELVMGDRPAGGLLLRRQLFGGGPADNEPTGPREWACGRRVPPADRTGAPPGAEPQAPARLPRRRRGALGARVRTRTHRGRVAAGHAPVSRRPARAIARVATAEVERLAVARLQARRSVRRRKRRTSSIAAGSRALTERRLRTAAAVEPGVLTRSPSRARVPRCG